MTDPCAERLRVHCSPLEARGSRDFSLSNSEGNVSWQACEPCCHVRMVFVPFAPLRPGLARYHQAVTSPSCRLSNPVLEVACLLVFEDSTDDRGHTEVASRVKFTALDSLAWRHVTSLRRAAGGRKRTSCSVVDLGR